MGLRKIAETWREEEEGEEEVGGEEDEEEEEMGEEGEEQAEVEEEEEEEGSWMEGVECMDGEQEGEQNANDERAEGSCDANLLISSTNKTGYYGVTAVPHNKFVAMLGKTCTRLPQDRLSC